MPYQFTEEITDNSYKITCNYCSVSQSYYSPDFVKWHKKCAARPGVQVDGNKAVKIENDPRCLASGGRRRR